MHTATEAKHEVESGFFLDVIVGECSAVLELLAGENQSLLVWWDSLFILNLGFHVIDCVGGFDFQCDCFAG